MIRPYTPGLLLCAALCLTGAPHARAQEAETHIAQAQKTLTEISQLFQAIQARQADLTRNPGAGIKPAPSPDGWNSLFDGESLGGWKRTTFSDGGKARLEKNFRGGPSAIIVEAGDPLSGITWTNEVPRTNYEITLEAMKLDGNDFLCGLTFPVGDSHASLILGGWGGQVVGISSINNQDASENETTRTIPFPKDRWFAVRLRVTPDKIEAWLDDKQIVNVPLKDKVIGLRFGEISRSAPLGMATYKTTAAYRAIKLRRLN